MKVVQEKPVAYKSKSYLNKYQQIGNAIADSRNEPYLTTNTAKVPSLSISSISTIRPQMKIQTQMGTESNSNLKSSRQVLNEFKELLRQTDYITSKIGGNAYISNKSKANENKLFYESGKQGIDIDDMDEIEPEIQNEEINVSEDSINLDDITTEIQNYNENNLFGNNDYEYQKQKNENLMIQKEINKLKLSNQVLTRSNLDLRNGNKILELEINSYKTNRQLSNPSINTSGISITEYDLNLSKFLVNSKNSLNESINNNLYIMDQINSLQAQNQKLYEENWNLVQNYNEHLKEIEMYNRKNAEIMITNQENQRAYDEIENNNKVLTETLEKLKLELNELCSKEENLNLINDSNTKTKNDNEELLFHLKLTLEKLSKANSDNSVQIDNSQKSISEANYVLSNKKKEIIDLIDIVNSLSNELETIQRENNELSQKVNGKSEIEDDLRIKEAQAQKEYQMAYLDNENAKKENYEKDNFITVMKESIAKTIKLDESGEGAQNEDKDENLDQEISVAMVENERKKKELQEVVQMYEDILKRKDEIIKDLMNDKDDVDIQDVEGEEHEEVEHIDEEKEDNKKEEVNDDNKYLFDKEGIKRVEIDDLDDINDE